MMEEGKSKISVYDLIEFSLSEFAGIAWQKMGLRPDPITGEPDTDFEQAKVAVDIAARLAECLDPHLDDAGRRRVNNLLSDLRINYVRRSKE